MKKGKLVENQYSDVLRQIIAKVKSARLNVARRLNTTMMQMYWNIGKRLSEEDLQKGYGASVVNRLAMDLQQEFPGTTGFSPRNLLNMKKFYEYYILAEAKLQRCVAVLPFQEELKNTKI